MSEYAIRFLAGGLAVSVFALLGDILRPKSFAGLLGAAPSVALVSLALAFSSHGPDYTAIDARSMIIGAAALGIFGIVTCHALKHLRMSAMGGSVLAFGAWLMVAFGLYKVTLT